MPPSALTLPMSEDVAAARGNIRGFAVRTPLLKLSVDLPAQPAAAALANGRPVQVPHIQSFVDGMGSTTVLQEMWPLIRGMVDQAACASFAEIAQAIRLLAGRHHVIAEAAGAASVAV